MTRIEAIQTITGNDDKDTSKQIIEKKYKNALNLLKAQIRDAPTDEDKSNYERKVEKLKKAYPIAMGLPGVVPIKNEKLADIKQPWDDNDGSEVDLKTMQEKSKKPSFLESLMNPKIFFLVLTSLVSAILLLILWLGAKGDGALMEQMDAALTNKPFVIYNTGEKDYRLLGYKVFYFDREIGEMKEYSNYDPKNHNIKLTSGKKTDKIEVKASNGKDYTPYKGDVLFFELLYETLDGSETKVLADYAGSYKGGDGTLRINLDNIETE